MLSEGNYTAASIIAVDLCGQQNKPSLLKLNTTTISDSQTSLAISDMSQSRANVGGLTAGVVIMTVVICVLGIILVVLIVMTCYCSRQKIANLMPERSKRELIVSKAGSTMS